MARMLDIYAIQATLTGVDDVVRKLAQLQAAFGRTQMAMAGVALAGTAMTAGLLGRSIQMAFAFDKLAGAIRRVWAGEGPGMVRFVMRLAAETGFAVEELGRAAELMGSLGLGGGTARRILRVATEVGGAREMTAPETAEMAMQIARLSVPELQSRALRALIRMGLPLQGIQPGPGALEAVLARLAERFAGGLGAFEEFDSVLGQLTQTMQNLLITSGMPIIRLFDSLTQRGRPVLGLLVRIQELTHGWAGLATILGTLAGLTALLVRLWRTVIGAQIRMAVAAETLAASLNRATVAMGAAAGAGTAAAAGGFRALLGRLLPLLGKLAAVAAVVWMIIDIINQVRGARQTDDARANALRNIEDNTKRSAEALEGIARGLIGGGQRGRSAVSQIELQIALANALGKGVA